VILFARYAKDREDFLVFCCNFTPQERVGYRVGLPRAGRYQEVLNTDAEIFGGSNQGNGGWVVAQPLQHHGRPASASITIPPLGVVVLKPER
jgi:1,4-alpha-glucan branching enzyme